MTQEKKVPSLETCRKLREAGFPQSTERWWQENLLKGWLLYPNETMHTNDDARSNKICSAPDVSELLEALPAEWHGEYLFLFKQVDGKWDAAYSLERTIESDNPAEALALLWLELNKKA